MDATTMAATRIASLLPAGTEMVAALGGIDRLVGVSHECDFPAEVTALPRLTWSPIDGSASSAAIDAQVRALRADGRPVIATDGELLRTLAPDLIIAQDLCEVCAVVDGDLREIAAALDPPPRILPLRARTVAGIFADIEAVGAALARPSAARDLIEQSRRRLDRLRADPSAGGSPPTVVAVEWLEPLYLAGHWVPELIAAAGGRDIGARPGSHSVVSAWPEVAALDPDVVLVMLCGFGIERARREWDRFLESAGGIVAAGLRARIELVDGNAHTSRPGPRVVDGAERIAALLRGPQGMNAGRLPSTAGGLRPPGG